MEIHTAFLSFAGSTFLRFDCLGNIYSVFSFRLTLLRVLLLHCFQTAELQGHLRD